MKDTAQLRRELHGKEMRVELAQKLAEYFTPITEDQFRGACACNAPECGDVSCPSFWEHYLCDPQDLVKAVKMYSTIKKIME
jgi:hypothetical protein